MFALATDNRLLTPSRLTMPPVKAPVNIIGARPAPPKLTTLLLNVSAFVRLTGVSMLKVFASCSAPPTNSNPPPPKALELPRTSVPAFRVVDATPVVVLVGVIVFAPPVRARFAVPMSETGWPLYAPVKVTLTDTLLAAITEIGRAHV